MKCLILRATSLGDIVHTFPAITELKQKKNIQIDFLVDSKLAEVVKANQDITRIWELPFLGIRQFGYLNFIRYSINLIKQINSENYDAIIDLHNVFKTSWLNIFLKGKKYSFTKLKEPLPVYDYQFEVREYSQVYRYKELFAKIFDYSYSKYTTADNLKYIDLSTKLGLVAKCYTLLIIDSSWLSKLASNTFWQKLIDSSPTEQLVIFSGSHLEQANSLAQYSGRVKLLPPLPLDIAISVVANAKSIIGVDTGLAHLGASFGVPSVMIFGATDCKFYSFYKNLTSLQAPYPCAGCYNKKCNLNKQDLSNPCYDSIGTEIVWEKLKSHSIEK